MKITVIGGANTDICGAPAAPLVLKDSNPGAVTLRAGGVGRNIAHNLRLLGADVSFIAPFGDDAFSAFIKSGLGALGIDFSRCLTVPGERSSVYLYLTDGSGDMHAAIADMDIVSRLTPTFLSGCEDVLRSSDAVVLDANLTSEAAEYICRVSPCPVYADPVSGAKAPKLRNVLSGLACLKPNALEAEILTGEKNPSLAARALCKAGVRRAFVSAGAEGIFACEGGEVIHVPAFPARAVNATGAGDAATAALVYAGVSGMSLEASALLAARAGAVTAESPETVSPAISSILK